MFVVNSIFTAQNEIKKSKFIAYLCSFDEFENLKQNLAKEHKKAAHIVWAYRKFGEFNQIYENSSDDGEPKNSAGSPILDVLRGNELVNSAILVIRYFGGIKLGVGGLVRAYSGAANLVIKTAVLDKFEFKIPCEVFVPFALIARFEHYFEQNNILANKDFLELGCKFGLNLTQNQKDKFDEFCTKFSQNGVKFNNN